MSSMTLVYALLAGLLPSLIWLWFWMREDSVHPEPRLLLILCFIGGMISVIVAAYSEQYFAQFISNINWRYTVWASIEEILKFIVVAVIALSTAYNDEPIDAMIYAISVALGFAALENAFFLWEPLSNGELAKGLITQNMRFLGATLVHVVSSASIGFALGIVFYKSWVWRIVAAVIGLSAAITLHTAFNLSIINNTQSTEVLQTFGWVWGAAVLLIVLFEEVKMIRPRLPQIKH